MGAMAATDSSVTEQPARPRPTARRWVLTPLCLSVLFHVSVLTILGQFRWWRIDDAEEFIERSFSIETGIVNPEDVEHMAASPEEGISKSAIFYKTTQIGIDELPKYQDVGLRDDLPKQIAMPRYPEEELPLVSREDLSLRSRVFVRDGELDVPDPDRSRVTYIPTGRIIEREPTVQVDTRPRLREAPSAFARHMSGTERGLLDVGAAPTLDLDAPERGHLGGRPYVASLPRDAEALFADSGRFVPTSPMELDVKIDVYAEPDSQHRFFRLMAQERPGRSFPPIAKNVLFVVDISSSIRLEALRSVRSAIADSLAGLNPADKFNVVRFSEHCHKAFDGFVPATRENIAAAVATVRREPGEVRTDVYAALKAVIADIPTEGPEAARPTNIFLITDGNATTGIQDLRRIVDDLTSVTRTNYSIFAINPGSDTANTYLLDLLAYRNRGVFVAARTPDATDATLLRLLMEHKNPVLINLRAQFGNFQVDHVYPETLPNLYSGRPIIVHGRCLPGDTIGIRIVGDSATDRRTFIYTSALPDILTKDPSIAREWARGKIHHLASLIARDGEKVEYMDEIRYLSERYKLASPYE